jgi:hypothetical protein
MCHRSVSTVRCMRVRIDKGNEEDCETFRVTCPERHTWLLIRLEVYRTALDLMPLLSYSKESSAELRDRLASGLEGSACVWSLLSWFEDLQQRHKDVDQQDRHAEFTNDASARQARKAVYDAQNICYAWVTRPRDRLELDAFFDMHCACSSSARTVRAKQHDDVLKMSARGSLQSDLIRPPFTHLLASFLQPLVDMQLTNEDLHLRRIKLERRTRWRRTLQDLIPHGVENTVRALATLLDQDAAIGRRSVLVALTVLIDLHRTSVLPFIVTSRTFIVRGFIDTIQQHVQFVRSAGQNIKTADLSDVVNSTESMIKALGSIVMNYTNMSQRRTFHAQETMGLLRAYDGAIALIEMLRPLITHPRHSRFMGPTLLDDEYWEVSVLMWSKMGGRLLDDCPEAQRVAIQLQAGQRICAAGLRDSFAPPYAVPWFQFAQAISILETYQQCSAPRCSKDVWTASLQRCAGCERVVYCSRVCQKAAWRGSVPHRNVCKTIAALSKRLNIPKRDMAAFRSGIIPYDQWCLIQLDAAAIVDHFDKLASVKAATAGELFRLRSNEKADTSTA